MPPGRQRAIEPPGVTSDAIHHITLAMSAASQLPAPTGAAARTHAAIVETAERLFRTIGYQKTTVADIARALHMSPANVYRFFPSKAAINHAIAARCLAELDAAAWAVARGPGSAAARVRALFALLQQQTEALFFQERRLHDMVAAALEQAWPTVEQHIATIDAAFRHIVVAGQQAGEFAPLDPDEAARFLHGSCLTFTHPMLIEKCIRHGDDLPALAARNAEFCLRALRPDAPATPPG
jgi:AcrR family transcriptional regulator